MNEDKDIKKLFISIQKCLEQYTINELTEALVDVLDGKYDKGKYVNKVFSLVSKKYNVPVNKILKSNSRGNVQVARRMSYCLLYLDLELKQGYIANRIFHRSKSLVSNAVKNLIECENSKIKHEIEFNKNYKELKIELAQFIKEDKKQ